MGHENLDKLADALTPARIYGQLASLSYYDQRTIMPPGGADGAAERAEFLGKRGHQAVISDEVRRAIERCEEVASELTSLEQLAIIRLRHCFDRAANLPAEFVGRRDMAFSVAGENWKKARAAGDFKLFRNDMATVFELAQEEAERLGAIPGNSDSIYDTLLDRFEPGMTTAEVRTVLGDLGQWLTGFKDRIMAVDPNRSDAVLRGCFPKEKQILLVRHLATLLGYDFSRGTLQETTHPFAASICAGDHRITSRYYDDFISAALFGTAHEAGHAIFEQGASPLLWMLDNPGLHISLGIHESQSRTWENLVCRSWEFWQHYYSYLQLAFPVFNNVPLKDFYQAINIIRPSAIRVEADEVTYHGHILVRFEIEQAILSGQLSIDDAPAAFADLMEKYVGYRPKDLKEGILQDIHWSSGLIGYAATYTLGTLASAQEFATFGLLNPHYQDNFRQGDFSELLRWLRCAIHATGHFESLNHLLIQATGSPLTAAPFKEYVEGKYGPLYGLAA